MSQVTARQITAAKIAGRQITGTQIGASAGGAIDNSFRSVWATTAEDETITIQCQNVGTFNADVDWGDGSAVETITTYNGFSHEYDDIGEHTISITGVFPNIYIANGTEKTKIKKVLNLGTVGWTNLSSAFYGCSNLIEFTAGSTDTSGVSGMATAFRDCSGLTSIDVSSFDTSSVTNMFGAFRGCSGLTSMDVSSFNTANVSRMDTLFFLCSGLTSIVGVEDWDITGLNSTGDLTNFLGGGKMTTAQYDALLVNWEAQASGIPAMTPSFGASEYTGGGAAATAHASLTDVYGWSIGDGGIA